MAICDEARYPSTQYDKYIAIDAYMLPSEEPTSYKVHDTYYAVVYTRIEDGGWWMVDTTSISRLL